MPSLRLLFINLTVHLELSPGYHVIWCKVTLRPALIMALPFLPAQHIQGRIPGAAKWENVKSDNYVCPPLVDRVQYHSLFQP